MTLQEQQGKPPLYWDVPQPEHCHPLVRELCELMRQHRISQRELARRAGLHFKVINYWRFAYSPRMVNFVAALNAIGYDLKIVPMEDGK